MEKNDLNNLMLKVQKGDENAFAELYGGTAKGLFAYIFSVVRNAALSEDIMQETYIKVRRNAQSYKAGTNFTAWLLQIAKHLCFNELKRGKRETATDFSDYDAPSDFNVEEQADTTVYDAILKNLEPEAAQIVILHAVHGLKHREIAEMMKKPLGTVLWTYNSALKKLSKILKKEDER